MEEDLAKLAAGLHQARNAVLAMMERSATDPRLAFFSKHTTALWHVLVAGDFLQLDVVNAWKDFKGRTGV